jgi:hypothetical protein
MPSELRRDLRCAALLAILSVVGGTMVAGCSTVPDSGPILPGAAAGVPGEDTTVRVLPREPTTGETPEALVEGFLQVSGSLDRDHDVARTYLTPEAAARWQPDVGIVVYSAEARVASTTPTRYVLTGRQVATVGSDGRYETALTPPRALGSFGLVKRKGQWRIASLPDGLLLARDDLDRSYQLLNVYFLNPGKDRLVPEQVYLPKLDVATAAVRSLIAGPRGWLAPAVRTGFPPAARLAGEAVPVTDDGVAVVALNAAAQPASPVDQAGAIAQLARTLSQVPGVERLRIMAGGASLVAPGSSGDRNLDQWRSFDPDASVTNPEVFAVRSGNGSAITLGSLRPGGESSGGVFAPVAGPLGRGSLVARRPDVSPEGDVVAALDGSGKNLFLSPLDGPGAARTVYRGADLTRATWDSAVPGSVWVVDRSRGGSRIIAASGTGSTPVTVVSAPDVATQRVESLRLSRDATRAAVVVRDGIGPRRLLVARVVRRNTGITLEAARLVSVELGDVGEVSWRNSGQLVVVIRGNPGGSVVAVDPYGIHPETLYQFAQPLGPLAAIDGRTVVVAGEVLYDVSAGSAVVLGRGADVSLVG